MHILHVVGARPNFMKAAPLLRELGLRKNVQQTLVHTGQHYDPNMSEVFFKELGIAEPDLNLAVGSGSQTQQTATIMARCEPVLLEKKPDITLVYGDVNSTLAVALVCAKLLLKIGHVEAGLRSRDRAMPEEINRVITDHLADVLFTPSEDANQNLAREGIDCRRVHFVGNIMIDSLVRLLPQAESRFPSLKKQFALEQYGLVTLHRPSNVDHTENLGNILTALGEISRRVRLVFPVHPRTAQKMGKIANSENLKVCEPLSYLDFLSLQSHAAFVITDSGGVQEETTYLGIPCITVRSNTERPVTIQYGSNVLVGNDINKMQIEVNRVLSGKYSSKGVPPLWDGHTSARIADVLLS